MSSGASDTSSQAENIRKFESRVLNRSCADMFIYDKLADLLLEYCSAETRPNLLSLMSLLPLIICNLIVESNEWWSCILAFVALLLHQIFDIANKKQAYRLSAFTFSTYYIDHLYDAISCLQIVFLTSTMFRLDPSTQLVCTFFFGMLPFYTHHLAMYSSGYLTFYAFSPAVEGLMILEILILLMIPFNQLPEFMVFGISFTQIVLALATLFLVVFLFDDLRVIYKSKSIEASSSYGSGVGYNDTLPLKNLFVIAVIGYLILETTMIESHLLEDIGVYSLLMNVFCFMFVLVLCDLVLAYGCQAKFRQFGVNTLGVMLLLAVFYTIFAFSSIDVETEVLVAQILVGLVLCFELPYFFYFNFKKVKYLNSVINQEDQG